MTRLTWPGRSRGDLPLVDARTDVVVECNVCHVAGVLEVEADRAAVLQADWEVMACAFTPHCIGHVWPEAIN